MTSSYSPSSMFSLTQSYRTPATTISQQTPATAASTPEGTPDSASSPLGPPSSDPIFQFSPSLAQEIAAGRAAQYGYASTARTRTASQRLQEAMQEPQSTTLRPVRQTPLIVPTFVVSFAASTPLGSPAAPQAPSSDLIFEFSPSLAQQIAESRSQPSTQRPGVAARAPRATASSQRLQSMMATTPTTAFAPSARPPLRHLDAAFSFNSESAQTAGSIDSVQVSLRSGDTGSLRRSASPSPEGFAMHRWLSNEAEAPQRRPSTPMPPIETMREDQDSDSDVTQGPCEHLTKRQRRS